MGNIKFVYAKQAQKIYEYNTKEKLLKTNTTTWFNKTCLLHHLTPKYANVQIKGNNRHCINTTKAAVNFRLKQELKFAHIKKQKLNEKLYHTHLEYAEQ
jgi:hypothetical protein